MLRWMLPLLVAMFAVAPVTDADAAKQGVRRAARQLPAGLPRPHYKFKTTVSPATRYGRLVYFVAEPEVLFTPSIGYLPYEYDAWGPWYGGPYVGHWNRLPYACGTYGYC
jgi:hypothetical protein